MVFVELGIYMVSWFNRLSFDLCTVIETDILDLKVLPPTWQSDGCQILQACS